jgi:hypothetical protein
MLADGARLSGLVGRTIYEERYRHDAFQPQIADGLKQFFAMTLRMFSVLNAIA